MDRDRWRQPANSNCQGCRASHELCSNDLFKLLSWYLCQHAAKERADALCHCASWSL